MRDGAVDVLRGAMALHREHMGLACRAVQNVLCFLVGCVISNNSSSGWGESDALQAEDAAGEWNDGTAAGGRNATQIANDMKNAVQLVWWLTVLQVNAKGKVDAQVRRPAVAQQVISADREYVMRCVITTRCTIHRGCR